MTVYTIVVYCVYLVILIKIKACMFIRFCFWH